MNTLSIFNTRYSMYFLVVLTLTFCPMGAWGHQSLPQPSSGWSLTLKDGRLSAHIQQIPLRIVMEKFKEISQISTVINHTSANVFVTADFEEVPLETGLKRLLKGHPFTLTFLKSSYPSNSVQPTIQAIHVYQNKAVPLLENSAAQKKSTSPRALPNINTEFFTKRTLSIPNQPRKHAAKDQELNEIDLEDKDDKDLKELAADSPNPDIRLEALEELLDRGNTTDSLPLLQKELTSQDPNTREVILDLLDDLDNPPMDLISKVALTDPNLDIRLTAIDSLTDELDFGENPQPALNTLEKIALEDQEPEVRIEAIEVLLDRADEGDANPSLNLMLQKIIPTLLADSSPDIQELAKEYLE